MSAAWGAAFTALGEGAGDYGQLQYKGTIDALNDQAEMAKAQRLMSLEETQLASANMFKMANLDMNQERLQLSREEGIRAQEKHDKTMSASVGKWRLEKIENRVLGEADPITNERKSLELSPTYVLVNDSTGEVKPYDGRFGDITDKGGAGEPFTGTFETYWNKYVAIRKAEGIDVADTQVNRDKLRAHGEEQGITFSGEKETPPPPTEAPKIGKDEGYTGLRPGDSGFGLLLAKEEAGAQKYEDDLDWRTKKYVNIPYAEIGEIIATASEDNPSDNQWIAKTLGFTVDAFTAAINQLLPEGTTIRNPVMGSKWLMENRGWTVADLVKEVQTQVKTGRVGHPGSAVANKYKEDEAARLAALSPEAKRMMEINEHPESQGSPVAAKIAKYLDDPVGEIQLALEKLPSKDEIIKIVEGWPTPEPADPETLKKIQSVVDTVKAKIEEGKTVATEGLILGADAVVEQANKVSTILKESTDDSTASKAMAAALGAPVDWLSSAISMLLPPDAPIQNPVGGAKWLLENKGWTVNDLVGAIKTKIDQFNQVGALGVEHPDEGMGEGLYVGPEVAGVSMGAEYPTDDEQAALRLAGATLPLEHGQDDERIDDGQSLLDTKVALDPTQRSRRWDISRGRQGKGGLSMDADYRTLPGTYSPAHGQDDEAGQPSPSSDYKIEGLIGKAMRDAELRPDKPVETDVLKMDYDQVKPMIDELVNTLKESGMDRIKISDQILKMVGVISEEYADSDYAKALSDVYVALAHDRSFSIN